MKQLPPTSTLVALNEAIEVFCSPSPVAPILELDRAIKSVKNPKTAKELHRVSKFLMVIYQIRFPE